jgi:hypothetical protein
MRKAPGICTQIILLTHELEAEKLVEESPDAVVRMRYHLSKPGGVLSVHTAPIMFTNPKFTAPRPIKRRVRCAARRARAAGRRKFFQRKDFGRVADNDISEPLI